MPLWVFMNFSCLPAVQYLFSVDMLQASQALGRLYLDIL